MAAPRDVPFQTHTGATPIAVSQGRVLGGLSYALDLTEGQRPGHSVRSCLIGMRVADVAGIPDADREALFYALLLKDLGCSSNAARFAALFGHSDHDLKSTLAEMDWSRATESFQWVLRNVAPGQFFLKRAWRLFAVMSRGPEGAREVVVTRCERGADIASMLGLPEASVRAIRALDEHWDGQGQPYNLKGEEIPLLARVMNLAQTVEVFLSAHGRERALDVAAERRGRWFQPELVDALYSLRGDDAFWSSLEDDALVSHMADVAPDDRALPVDDARLDLFASAFARVIDAKSPWTFRHSEGVASVALAIADRMGVSADQRRGIRRSALLHDIGKLGVSNLVLDKPGRLSDDEVAQMRRHTTFTHDILARVPCFATFAADAAAHHERLDGRGYHTGLDAARLPVLSRILAVADVCDALRSSRPYREGLPTDQVLGIMERDRGTAFDPGILTVLRQVLEDDSVSQAVAPAADTPATAVVASLREDYVQAA